MATSKVTRVAYRRKRQQKTNYKRRLALLKSGKSRLIIKILNKNILAQIIEYSPKGDKVVAYSTSNELEKLGWKYSKSNTSAAYLTGLSLASKSKVKNAVLDTGLQVVVKGSKLFSCLKGVIDGGIDVPHDKTVFPKEERIKGENVAEFFKNRPKEGNQFSQLTKKKVDVGNMPKAFEEIKNKILNGVQNQK